jgi:hypothetical protein
MDALALGAHTLALVFGPPQLTGRMTRTVEGTSPPAIAGAVQQAMTRHAAPFIAIRPVPLELPPGGSVALLLAEEESMLIALAPAGAEAVHAAVDLHGEFPPGADANFRHLVASLAQSTMGTALGLRTALGTLQVEATATSVTLEADFDAGELARGLSLVFRAEISEVLEDPSWSDMRPAPPSTTN